MDNEIRYTTAPKAYDYPGTERVAEVGNFHTFGKVQPVWKLSIDPGILTDQTFRNRSALHPTWTEADFLELVERGLIKIPG